MTQIFALSNAHIWRHIPSGKLMIRKETWTEDGAILFDALTTPGSYIFRSPTLCEEKEKEQRKVHVSQKRFKQVTFSDSLKLPVFEVDILRVAINDHKI